MCIRDSDVTDQSDDPNTGAANDATIVNITPMPNMEVTKKASIIENGDGSLGVGDTVNYTITIENKGNVDLTSLVISDTFVDMASSTLALTTTPTFDFANLGSSQGTIAPGETAYYVATYLVDQAVIDIGGVINSVTVTASSTGGVVSDTSDDGIDTDGNTTDDVTVLVIDPNPILETTKTAVVSDVNSNSINDLGDIITYTIRIENKGNVTLSALAVSDTLTDGNDTSLALTSPPILSSNLNTYAINITALNASNYTLAGNDRLGGVNGNDVGVTINLGDTIEFNVNAAGHPFYIKTAQGAGANNLVNGVQNNGSENGTVRWKPTSPGTYYYQCSVHNAMYGIIKVENSLAVGGVVTYTATFNIDQQAVDSGSVNNSALAIASSPRNTNDVSDQSDDGDDGDGNTINDQTVVNISASSNISVTKEVASITDVNSNNLTDLGDRITYSIRVVNTGDLTLSGITLDDTLTDANSSTLSLDSGPTFVSATTSSTSSTLQVSGVSTYTAIYTVGQQAINSGSVINSIKVIASSPGQSRNVSNTSYVVTSLPASPSLEVTKTATTQDNNNNSIVDAGDKLKGDWKPTLPDFNSHITEDDEPFWNQEEEELTSFEEE